MFVQNAHSYIGSATSENCTPAHVVMHPLLLGTSFYDHLFEQHNNSLTLKLPVFSVASAPDDNVFGRSGTQWVSSSIVTLVDGKSAKVYYLHVTIILNNLH